MNQPSTCTGMDKTDGLTDFALTKITFKLFLVCESSYGYYKLLCTQEQNPLLLDRKMVNTVEKIMACV